MNVLIVEDEKQAAARLANLLQESNFGVNILKVADCVESAVSYLRASAAPDLIFLDIQLGDGKSFEIFNQVQINSHVIFTTAFDEYALQAFQYNSIDYLLKPIRKAELYRALEKFSNYFVPASSKLDIQSILSQVKPLSREYKTRFLVKKGSRFFSVSVEDVAMAYTRDKVHFIKTHAGEELIIDSNLEELEAQLDPHHFFKANRQFIISHKAIDQVHAWFDGKLRVMVKPASYEEIIISRLRATDFKKWMGR